MICSYAVDRVIIVKWNGYDTRNEPYPPTNVAVRGYVEWRTRLISDLQGEKVVMSTSTASPVTVHLAMKRTDKALGRALCHEDKFIVDGMERAIINIAEPKSFSCPHYEVALA